MHRERQRVTIASARAQRGSMSNTLRWNPVGWGTLQTMNDRSLLIRAVSMAIAIVILLALALFGLRTG